MMATSGSGAYRLDPDSGIVTRPDGTRAYLSPRERDILHVLHMMRGRWVNHHTIIDLVWRGHCSYKAVGANVRNIRRKCGADVIDTRGRGYGYGVGVNG